MKIRILPILFLIFCFFVGNAQQTPLEIKYKAWDIHALRYYSFTQQADSFMKQLIDRKPVLIEKTTIDRYEKTGVDLVMNKQFLANEISRSIATQNPIYKYAILPYNSWLDYARPVPGDSLNLHLTLFLSENRSGENRQTLSNTQSPLEWIGKENIRYYLEEWLGKVDLWKERNDVLFSSVKSPLTKDADKIYRYFFSSRTEIDDIPVYEIVFFSKKREEKAFEGYLYISENDLSLVKAIFTLNPFVRKKPAQSVLFIQTPTRKETLLFIGNEITTNLLVEQVRVRENESLDSIPADFLSPAQKEIAGLIKEAGQTSAYSNLHTGLSLLFANQISIFRNKFNLGPVTQMLSYNFMEGVRLRIGGYTSEKISDRAAVGGYLAYGTKDAQWKYRGDIIFTPRLMNRIQLTYVNDLNIPGYDCLKDMRDVIFFSLFQFHTTNMSLQKIGQLSYEMDGFHGFSLKLNTKYLYDHPLGNIKYELLRNKLLTTINDIVTSEIGASFRFAPNEKYFRIKGKRIVFRAPDVDFQLNHKIGIKGILNSSYNYSMTDASLFKSFDFPLKTGSFGIRLSGGKVWNSVPFPLLFIPAGNQSYIFDSNDYNLMQFFEFVTDRFVAGNANVQLNCSPVNWVVPKSSLKMHGGIRAIYGPLSDMNNPDLHPGLFIFNNGVRALGEKPYAEANIGLSGILKFFRIDYVYRLNYGNKGSVFVSSSINF